MPAPIQSADRVKDSSSSGGTSNLTLSGSAPTGYVDFNTAFGTNVAFYYTISASGSANWEVGIGHLSASTTLVRDTILASSNSGNATNFPATAFDIFCDCPAWLIGQLQPQSTMNQVARGNFLP